VAHGWSIGVYEGSDPLNLAPAAGVKNPVVTRASVTDADALYVADPFLLRADGIWHMFFEAFNRQTCKGEIAFATSEDGRRWSYRAVALTEPFHLSYPSVFGWDGEIYLLPESRRAGEVRLYRAERFPYGWSRVDTILENAPFVDPSIFRHDGRWWLFVESGSPEKDTVAGYLRGTLRLYHSEALSGPWLEHVCSPVIDGEPFAVTAGRASGCRSRLDPPLRTGLLRALRGERARVRDHRTHAADLPRRRAARPCPDRKRSRVERRAHAPSGPAARRARPLAGSGRRVPIAAGATHADQEGAWFQAKRPRERRIGSTAETACLTSLPSDRRLAGGSRASAAARGPYRRRAVCYPGLRHGCTFPFHIERG
jgi:hypothetical protein